MIDEGDLGEEGRGGARRMAIRGGGGKREKSKRRVREG
jgi:hypothetical protein